MNLFIAASAGDTITDMVNEVAKSLRYPVLILALIALLFVAYELGRLAIEAVQRSQRSKERFDNLARRAHQHAQAGDSAGAQALLRQYAYGKSLQQAAVGTMFAGNPIDAQRAVVDYDMYVSKRLDRIRLLVRSGPALGLMGTLIPLAPALAALGEGDAKVLADELQTAFAITVVGVAIGLVAFAVALVRERYYTKDLADLEFLRELRGDAAIAAGVAGVAAPAPAHTASSQGSDVSDAPTTVTPPTTPAAPAVAAPASAQGVSAAAAATASTPAAPTTPLQAPAAAPAPAPAGKKKFGIKRKSKSAAAAPSEFPPPPPPPAPVAPAPAPAAAQPPTAGDGVDKAASIPAASEASESAGVTDGDGGQD